MVFGWGMSSVSGRSTFPKVIIVVEYRDLGDTHAEDTFGGLPASLSRGRVTGTWIEPFWFSQVSVAL